MPLVSTARISPVIWHVTDKGGGMYDRRLSRCVLVSMIMMEFLFISFISSQEVQHVSTHLPNLQQIHGFRRSISHLNSPGVLCAIAQTKEHFFLFHFSSGKWRFTSFFCFWLHCRLFFLVNPGRCPNPPFFCFFFPPLVARSWRSIMSRSPRRKENLAKKT